MASRITIKFRHPHCGELTANTEVSMYWHGSISFLGDRMHFFCNSKTHNTRMENIREILEEFPKMFTNIDFYTEEGIEKVSFDLSEGYGIEF